MRDCDLHTHSRFFHQPPEVGGRYDTYGVRGTLAFAHHRGLDGIAVTNHDFYRPETRVTDACIPGIEISTTKGHLLVVGPDPPKRTVAGTLTPHEAVVLAHEHDCVAIVAHPFRGSTLRDVDADYDAVELNGKHPEYYRRAKALADDWEVPLVGGSDAHFPFEAGRLSTRFDVDHLTPESVVEAIRAGRVEPVVRDGRLFRALRSLYDRVHRAKRQV